MEIGEPQRTIFVEPLELPKPIRRDEPVPERREVEEPHEVPAHR